ncbi:TraB/GumN family protein [Luteolibacter flavescens]|uniref:TraB/GumN family protein n=1 Tax=Luteolibacter flavescens TaxID=1859460 RepID=A0ABT3FMN0_9BACT|nr:TraB/GumN family protein [Luteolibacter flavescens]MCW1884818.1 TraB/GumN family protein [Luteolibacter flavescens]
MYLLTRSIPCLSFAATALLSFISPVHAEAEHPVKPLLWKVEGPGVEKPSYLFGTLHVGDKRVVTLHPDAEKAFKESGAVHTEAPLDMKSQIASMPLMMRGDGKKLDDVIGEELAKRVEKELKTINPDLDATPFQPMKTWMVAYTLPFLPEQMKGIKPLDMVLWERGAAEGKKTSGMQEIKDQVEGFNSLSDEEQTALLKSSLDYLEKDRAAGKDRMKAAADVYVTGDVKKINDLALESMTELSGGEDAPLMKKLMDSILTKRDGIMADYVEATLKKDPGTVHFFAAGAAHYAGKDGVPSLLEKKGYKVTLMQD